MGVSFLFCVNIYSVNVLPCLHPTPHTSLHVKFKKCSQIVVEVSSVPAPCRTPAPSLGQVMCGSELRLWTFVSGYTPGTPYKVSCSPTSGAVPPYSSSPNPYQTAVYPVRSAYPQQSPYAQVGLGCAVGVRRGLLVTVCGDGLAPRGSDPECGTL